MKYYYWKIYLFLVFIVCVVCETQNESEQEVSESSREVKEFDSDKWRAVETHPQGSSGWIPHESSEVPKRRRLRKRKRRPQVTEEDSSEDYSERPLRKRIRPQRLDEINEPWEEEMSNEGLRRPYTRRRISPNYHEEIKINPSVGATIRFDEGNNDEERVVKVNYEKIRDPFTALEEAELKQKTNKPLEELSKPSTESAPSDLKALLKQSSSLSEILQQKNLTLSELLKGNQKVISALTEKPEIEPEVTTTVKPKRQPPSVGLKKNVNRNFEQQEDSSFEEISSRELLEAQRKRLALLHAHKENKIYTDVTKFDVVTEAVTERRVFVPSHPKYYTSMDYKPEFFQEEVTTTTTKPLETTTIQTTTFKNVVEFIKYKPKLPLTSAKLNKLSQSTLQKENLISSSSLPPNAFKIDFNEVYGLTNVIKTDEPFRMTFDINASIKSEEQNLVKPQTVTEKTETTTEEIVNLSTTRVTTAIPTTTKSAVEKIKHVTAKEEIMEILKDPISKERLSRILATRNMTIEELVEQRERGSSQLHLADIFHNETKEPVPKDEPFVGKINPEYFSTFPMFGRKQKSRPVFEENNDKQESKEIYTVTSFPTYKIEMKTNKSAKETNQPFLPIWRQLYPTVFTRIYESNNNQQKNEDAVNKVKTISENEYQEELSRFEEIENKLTEINNDRLNLDNFDEGDFINLPSGVKSAIIASLAIIGLSLIVFLTILVIFKISQKHKKRLSYSNSFSGSKIKSPILQSHHKRSFREIMNETLGRKKNYYKSHLQSMSDNIWESDKKPF